MNENYNYKPLPDGLVIKESSIEGSGLFTTVPLQKGKCLGITHVYNPDFENSLIRTPLGGFINHSYTPNCIIRTFDGITYSLYTLEPVEAYNELSCNYYEADCAELCGFIQQNEEFIPEYFSMAAEEAKNKKEEAKIQDFVRSVYNDLVRIPIEEIFTLQWLQDSGYEQIGKYKFAKGPLIVKCKKNKKIKISKADSLGNSVFSAEAKIVSIGDFLKLTELF